MGLLIYNHKKINKTNKKNVVASNTIWPEYKIINEDECEFDTEMSEDSKYSNSLVSGSQMDESFKSLLDNFEGDGDKKSWASFQECIARGPEQVLSFFIFLSLDSLFGFKIFFAAFLDAELNSTFDISPDLDGEEEDEDEDEDEDKDDDEDDSKPNIESFAASGGGR
ncbi:hypothetical protein LOK49_LG04G00923 [Camellia lanceoleosa]|uniref:Uncharacterized protein n=1 Tax=Camellia lanceoleosa TaxID=1840588 RepID=A0ACC0I5B2_9ERIC|nr:hypothetical protein LOK49_LG04G00923 [Camellia lanceoleosa]